MQRKSNSKSKSILFEVASGDIPFANAKNCAQFFTPCPQSFRHTSLPAGHATEKYTSRLNRYIKSNEINKRIKEFYIKPTKENISQKSSLRVYQKKVILDRTKDRRIELGRQQLGLLH